MNPIDAEIAARRRLQDLAWALEQEEARQEMEQDRREMDLERRQLELELQGRRTAVDLDAQRQEQERRLELDERRRELELETALLNQERAVLGQLKVDPAAEPVADQAAAGATITRIYQSFQSREDNSDERLLQALQRANPNLQFVSPSGAAIPSRGAAAAPIQTATFTDQRGRPVRIGYGSPEISLEDRLRYGGAPRLVQVSRPGAQPVYRFADSDEILYSTVQQSPQTAAFAAQSPAPLVKQPLAARSAALQSSSVDAGVGGAVTTDLQVKHP